MVNFKHPPQALPLANRSLHLADVAPAVLDIAANRLPGAWASLSRLRRGVNGVIDFRAFLIGKVVRMRGMLPATLRP